VNSRDKQLDEILEVLKDIQFGLRVFFVVFCVLMNVIIWSM
jgi:hypothetical protein